jgi:NADH dehydrogenase
MSMTPRIVIIGGGFAGVKCAQILARKARSAEVVVFSRDNHMVFQPLLPDVAGSSLNPRAVAPPLRLLLPKARVRTEEVLAIEPDANEIVHQGHDGTPRRMRYDQLVIACGNVVNLNLLPGMANHALPLKTIGDAIAMRAHVMQQLEKADLAETEEQRRFYLTFIVVGGGFSGVEVAGELNDLIHGVRRSYPNIRREDVMVTLLHGQPELLPEVSSKLRQFARRRMEKRGIRVITEAVAAEVTARGVTLVDGRRHEGATVICTIGTTSNPLVAMLDAKKERGRLVTEPDMRLIGRSNVWAVGDCAIVPNAWDNKPAPPTAQFGERAGGQCALNIARVLENQPTLAFHYKPIGAACGIGGRQGVAELFGFKFSGFVAWWLWRSGFLVKIPSLAQKIKVGLDWAWELVFPRDLSHFRPAQSDPISKAHYAPGDLLVQPGQTLEEIYSIESGEAEVLVGEAGAERLVMSLPAGSVLGRDTLAEFRAERVQVRAKTAIDLYVLGRDSLTRLSKALAPVEELIERAVKRPALSIWRHHPGAMRALASRRAGELPTSYPVIAVDAVAKLGTVFQSLIEQKHGCALVLHDGVLTGISTRSDMLEALARGATRDTPITEAMNTRPVSIAHDDPATRAAELMADRGLKFLPILDASGRPQAILSADDFVRFALSMPR